MSITPEEQARQSIDAQLIDSGWLVQTKDKINLSASRGVAICELSFATGEPDYTLFVDGKALGTVEAKPAGHSLVGVEEQSIKYVTGVPAGLPAWHKPLPFCYESTGSETRFTNRLDPDPRSRNVFAFHRPETLLAWVQESGSGVPPLSQRLRNFPPLAKAKLWPAQFEAITNLEKSFAAGRPRALIQMATGSGKTFTAVNFIYRLVKYGGAKRILFLVDRGNLGEQTLKEFQQFVSPVNNYKFTEEYIVQHLTSNTLDTSARVVIGTIQRVFSMLKGEREPAPDLDDLPIESAEKLFKEPVPVEYNPAFPIEEFDFIVTDECHRSIYNLWRQVLEYFDCTLIGLTATPSKQTFGFFKQNLVMEYNHEKAVADGVNVGSDIYRINTAITTAGSKVEAGLFVDKRERATRKVRWEQLDEPLAYDANVLDRDVVAPDQIRLILATFRDRLFTEIFPGRTDVPKTLIFAKDDSHADDIVRICREVFDKGNDFCKKITYKTTGESPKALIAAFRNSYFPRIAVTVDMIATGTDIKPLEIVFFMRSVASKNFFEQMKGRGVRVVSDTEMEQVNPGIKRKTRYVIVDAVGVCERVQTESRPLEKKPAVSFDKLLDAAALGTTEVAAVESLAGRLIRLERRFDAEVEAEVVQTAQGRTLSQIAKGMLDAVDPDKVEEASRLLALEEQGQNEQSGSGVPPLNYFDPEAPVAFLSGDLPHWRQQGTTYFVTFRLADSLPQAKLNQWRQEREKWLADHPEPNDEATRREYYDLFPQRLQQWLDAGSGSCALAIPEVKTLVENALRHFDGQRYRLHEFVVAPNHVHALVSPSGEHMLSEILHSWKSFTAHELLKLAKSAAKSGRAVPALVPQNSPQSGRAVPALIFQNNTVWQKESFDHIVRSPASMEKFRDYIRNHGGAQSGSGVPPLPP
ncbi:MAG: DEAD/DEAH box helicase family protein [Verrucomicrobiae bacterium]|nr:DEAD/DEAH box helicase family protein [Verrucomicrobiae bacterium]